MADFDNNWMDDDSAVDLVGSLGVDMSGAPGGDGLSEMPPEDYGQERPKSGIKAKVPALIFLGVGVLFIVIVALIFGKNPKEEAKKTENNKTQQTQQQPQTAKPIAASIDWQELQMSAITNKQNHSGVFVITNMRIYGRNTGSDTLSIELRAELTGSISGHGGTFKVDVPCEAVALIDQRRNDDDPNNNITRIDVTYSTGEVDGVTVIFDVKAK